MTYALVNAGVVVTHPYSFSQLLKDNPDVSYPRNPNDAALATWGVVVVEATAKPAHDPITQNVVEGTPAFSAGAWRQTWNVVAASAPEIAARQTRADFDASRDAVNADTWVQSFLAMTPTEAQAYVNNNSANLTALRINAARLAFMVNVLMKRELRG